MLESRDAWRQPGLIPPAATEGVRRIFYGDLGKNSIQTSAESQNDLRQDLRDATVCGVTILFPPVDRRLAQVVRARMQEGPVILLEGPRSVGKSTLLREVAESHGALVTRMSRVPWNFGGGPMIIRLRSRSHHDGRHRHPARRHAAGGRLAALAGAGGR